MKTFYIFGEIRKNENFLEDEKMILFILFCFVFQITRDNRKFATSREQPFRLNVLGR